jgi:hypothetical protein
MSKDRIMQLITQHISIRAHKKYTCTLLHVIQKPIQPYRYRYSAAPETSNIHKSMGSAINNVTTALEPKENCTYCLSYRASGRAKCWQLEHRPSTAFPEGQEEWAVQGKLVRVTRQKSGERGRGVARCKDATRRRSSLVAEPS